MEMADRHSVDVPAGHPRAKRDIAGRNAHQVPFLTYRPTLRRTKSPMRTSRIAGVLVGVAALAALCGCGTAGSSSSTISPAATTTSSYTLIQEPQAGYQPIYAFISSAKKTLDMTMYSLSDPKADAALVADAKRGVAVRVLFDSDPTGGGGKAANQAAYNDLKSNGVGVKWAWPGVLWHQKSIVCDDAAVAVMSCNLYAPDYAVVRDFAVITTNLATASGVGATFNADWANTGTPPTPGVVPPGSELIWSPGAQSGVVKLVGSARSGTTLYAEDEQLDSPAIEQALVAAAKKGVTVDLTMTYSSSYVAGFKTLVAGGVHVSLYHGSTPLYIHAKAISVNNSTVYVGSSNFTTAMTNDDRNVGIITANPSVVHGVTATMASDFAGATPY
jgi:cardiolipin synthase